MITSRTVSSLEKIFHDSEPTCASLSEMSMLGNERASFQLAYFSDEDTQCGISVSGWKPENIKIYKVVEINSDLPAFEDSDFYFLRKTPGLYPDMLEPVEDNSFFAESGHHGSLWIELDASGESAGRHDIFITVSKGKETVTNVITVDVINAKLPEQALMCTMWFHCDCLATYYKVDVFSEEHWNIIENYVRNAANHGVNFILLRFSLRRLIPKSGKRDRPFSLSMSKRQRTATSSASTSSTDG